MADTSLKHKENYSFECFKLYSQQSLLGYIRKPKLGPSPSLTLQQRTKSALPEHKWYQT